VKDQVQQIQSHAERLRPEEVLRWAFSTFDQDVAISSGMGVEGMVLLDITSRIAPNLRVFTIDTEFLFPETYDLIERIEKRYGIRIERLMPALTPERQEEVHGAALWARNPDQCCNIRKIEPLKKKLSTLRAWITAIRRDQTSHRANAKRVEWDSKFGLIKINPLVDWTSDMVWNYVRKHDVPYNVLHDRNFPSIGCTHCTRAVRQGEDPRAGRWAGAAKTECGLHTVQSETGPVLVRINAN
jgi:phosphoadenosine phosphosulfate reductase